VKELVGMVLGLKEEEENTAERVAQQGPLI